MRGKTTQFIRAGQGQNTNQNHKGPREKPGPREGSCPEWAQPRRSAVDTEILVYLGNLAKRDPEGFVYPLPATVARRVQRSSYYVGQRIRFLEGIRRLVPVVRVRHGREIRGWLVIRFKDWLAKQDQAMASEAAKDLDPSSDYFARASNSSVPSKGKDDPNQKETQALTAKAGRRSSGFKDLRPTRPTAAQSQSTVTATATTRRCVFFSRKQEEQTLADRIAAKISREGETLQEALLRVQEQSNQSEETMADLMKDFDEACAFLNYSVSRNDPTLTQGFCLTFLSRWDKYEDRLRSGEMKRSIFCSKVIDMCVIQEEFWPPSFAEHRNKLARSEKAASCIAE